MSIALVVLIHVLSPFFAAEALLVGDLDLVRLLSRSARFVVPMFVVLTGALVWTRVSFRDQTPGEGRGVGAFLARRARSVLVPYLVWSAVYMLLTPQVETASRQAVADALGGLVLGTTWYHLYFVPVILGVYLLAPLAVDVRQRFGAGAVALAALAVGLVVPAEAARLGLRGHLLVDVLVLVATYLPFAGMGAGYAGVRDGMRWCAAERATWFPLLALGLALRVWFGALHDWPTHPYLAAGLNIVMNAVQCLGLLGLARVLLDRVPALGTASVLAPLVFGVYLTHPLLIEALLPLASDIVPAGLWVLLAWPLVTVGCFAGVRAVSRYRRLWWLHGVSPARTPSSGPRSQASAR